MRVRRSAPLLVVLFAVAAGLLGMHTLGHLGPQPTPAHAEMSAAPVTGHQPAIDIAGRPAPMERQASIVPGPPGGHRMPAIAAMCLAVLAAAIVVTRRSSSARGRAAALRARSLVRPVAAALRGPPLGLGLRLADLSVMRN